MSHTDRRTWHRWPFWMAICNWKELTEKARQICAGWEENEWVRRIVLEMISLLDSDDAERRRIALEVEKEMEAAEQKMNAA